MGCFCKQAVDALNRPPPKMAEQQQETAQEPTPDAELIIVASQWLSARWLPAEPWQPDPAWLDIELPPPLPPDALAVLCAIVQAGEQCQTVLGIDPADPADLRSLTRIVATLNRRTEALRELAADDQPWSAIAALNDHADAVVAAAATKVFERQAEQEEDVPFTPWRPFLTQLKALASLVAIGQMLGIDLADPASPSVIANRVRTLRVIELPPLADPQTFLQVITRASALDRLGRSLGQDPRTSPAERIKAVVDQKVARAADLLPDTLRAGPAGLLGAPQRQPNPTLLANPAVVQAASRVPNQPLPWKVPAFDQIPLLTVATSVLTLIGLLGRDLVRTSPCGRGCDAAVALKDVAPSVIASPGSGTGARPAA